jgi:hypothetical protein
VNANANIRCYSEFRRIQLRELAVAKLPAFPDAIAIAGASAAFDRLARDVVVRAGFAGTALIATLFIWCSR